MKYIVDGVELIGRQKGMGYKVPFYLIRTPQGKFIQVTQLLFDTVKALQEKRSLAKAATVLSKKTGKHVDTKAVRFLIDNKLAPLGIIRQKSSKNPPVIGESTPDLMLSLRGKVILFSEIWASRIATFFLPLFWPPVMIAIVLSALYIDVRLLSLNTIPEIAEQTASQPFFLFIILAIIILSTLFHEFGHAAGCKYGGGRPGKIGVGLYLVWPAFFTDVTDSYRLGRIGRLRSDVGGVYFNLVCLVVLGIAYHSTHFTPLLIAILFQNVEILHQIMPFLRLDGYFIVSDIVGIPNLYNRMGPVLKSIVSRQYQQATADLKPWVRWVMTFWVVATVPLLAYFLIGLTFSLPEIFSGAWSAVVEQGGLGMTLAARGSYGLALVHALQLAIYLFPTLGIAVTLYRFARQIGIRLAEVVKKQFVKRKEARPGSPEPIVIFDRSVLAK